MSEASNPPPTVQATTAFQQAAQAIVDASLHIYQRGWAPATSSNFSLRLDEAHCAITVSGKDKGQLRCEDIMRVDFSGQAVSDDSGPGTDKKKPSAETLLHAQLYRRDASIGAVLHTHSLTATLISMSATGRESALLLEGLELLKAFAGTDSHLAVLRIPIFDNTQDIAALAREVDAAMDQHGTGHVYLIRGHGIYTWGRDMNEAMRHLEALEYLLEYSWRTRKE
jgi:methylthioribulose-1-phosphate dehydratase